MIKSERARYLKKKQGAVKHPVNYSERTLEQKIEEKIQKQK